MCFMCNDQELKAFEEYTPREIQEYRDCMNCNSPDELEKEYSYDYEEDDLELRLLVHNCIF